jgi:glycosyltransferase involved in cell wall biosynthesis
MNADLSIVVPVYNEGENIRRLFDEIAAKVGPNVNEVVLVYDFEEDDTLPVVRKAARTYPFPIRLARNAWGRGALNAIRTGFKEARGPMVLVCMADLSDDLIAVPAMVNRMREGCDVVCGSRYMRGGRQNNGPLLKRTLSRLAGLSLHFLTGIPTHDITNSFKLYRKELLNRLTIESSGGFEVGMEIVAKTFVMGGRIAEVPSVWNDRSAGVSRFRMWKWMPNYLRWYWFAIKGRFYRVDRPVGPKGSGAVPRPHFAIARDAVESDELAHHAN